MPPTVLAALLLVAIPVLEQLGLEHPSASAAIKALGLAEDEPTCFASGSQNASVSCSNPLDGRPRQAPNRYHHHNSPQRF